MLNDDDDDDVDVDVLLEYSLPYIKRCFYVRKSKMNGIAKKKIGGVAMRCCLESKAITILAYTRTQTHINIQRRAIQPMGNI